MFPTATKLRNSSSIKCRSLVWSLGNQTCSQEVWSYWFPPLCQTLSVPPAPCQSTSLHTKQERKPGVKTNLSTPLGPWLELHRVNRGQDTTVRLISPHLQELVCLFKSAQKKKSNTLTKPLNGHILQHAQTFLKTSSSWCSQMGTSSYKPSLSQPGDTSGSVEALCLHQELPLGWFAPS